MIYGELKEWGPCKPKAGRTILLYVPEGGGHLCLVHEAGEASVIDVHPNGSLSCVPVAAGWMWCYVPEPPAHKRLRTLREIKAASTRINELTAEISGKRAEIARLESELE